MIRRSWPDSRADMQATNSGKKVGGKERWRKGKLNLLLFLLLAVKVTVMLGDGSLTYTAFVKELSAS